jgi:hypothetical protein
MPRFSSRFRSVWVVPLVTAAIGLVEGCGGEVNQTAPPPVAGGFPKGNPAAGHKPQKGMDRVGSEAAP